MIHDNEDDYHDEDLDDEDQFNRGQCGHSPKSLKWRCCL
jgi:hypothetical protein